MISSAEARQCAGLARQIRGLLTGIDNLGDAFTEAENLDVRVATARKEKLLVEADVVAVRAAFAKLDGDFQSLQKQYGQLDADYRTKKAQLEATLSTVQAAVADAQKLKRETEEQLAAITAKWNLAHG